MILKDVYIKDELIIDTKHNDDIATIKVDDGPDCFWSIPCTIEEYRAAIASINIKAVEK